MGGVGVEEFSVDRETERVGEHPVHLEHEIGLLSLLDLDDPVSDNSASVFIRDCAIEMGRPTTADGIIEPPSLRDVS